MTPEDYSRIRAIFDRAMDLPEAERRTFVEGSIAADDPLRPDLLAMVASGDESGFLATADMPGADKPAKPGPPVQIGNYKILREIAHGGMGVVFLALRNDDVFHKVVALKVIDGKGATQPDFVQRFKQERQILAGLDHPNIARILDGGNTDDGRPFYVMEYVAGSPIDDYCNRTAPDIAARVRMITDVCHAVEYLHTHAIAHRDIKPNNILVTPEGRVKLVDFGIAKVDTVDGLVASASSPGQPTMIMTPGYASPEQLNGAPSGKSGDIYSLAVVLYQLLTGRLPYVDQDGRPNLVAQLSGSDPEPPSKEWKSGTNRVSGATDSKRTSQPDLDRVILMALQRDPSRRYPTVQMFAEDLQRCLDGRPIAARQENWAYRFRKLVSRNRLAASLAALVVVFAAAGIWMAVAVRIERAQLEAKEAEMERVVALLNNKVARWLEPQQAAADKVADVETANRVMTSDTLRTLSVQAPDPERLKRLVAELRRFLDRADDLSQGQPLLRKEIALVYRRVGDFESTAPRPQIADKTRAAASYRRAAAVAASVRSVEPSWTQLQLSELGGRLQEIGSPLNVSPEPVPAPPPPTADLEPAVVTPPPVASPKQTIAAPPPPAPRAAANQPREAPKAVVDPQLQAELMRSLRTTTENAERARGNLDALRAALAGRGQAVRTDLLTSMSRVDSLLEDAKSALSSNDLEAADDSLHRAAAELKKLFKAVGG